MKAGEALRNNDVDRYRRRFYSLCHSAATCFRAHRKGKTARRPTDRSVGRPRSACQTDSGSGVATLFDFAPRAPSASVRSTLCVRQSGPKKARFTGGRGGGLLHKHHELFSPLLSLCPLRRAELEPSELVRTHFRVACPSFRP